MVNKYVAPSCVEQRKNKELDERPAEEENISCFHFLTDEKQKSIWESKLPLKDFKSKQYTVLCEKHFAANDIQTVRCDQNKSRLHTKDKLVRKILKKDAVPSIWPSCSKYLSQRKPYVRPTKLSSSIARE
jgi:hypothetical protein